jgi:hypothetical protein
MRYYDDYDPYDDPEYERRMDFYCALAEDGETYCELHRHVYPLDDEGEDPGCPKCTEVQEMRAQIEAGEVAADAVCYACEGALSETAFMGQRVCWACYRAIANGETQPDECQFADPGGRSALRAAGPGNPRVHPCPSCQAPNRLTPQDVARGYQCDSCADALEGGWGP